MARAIGKLCRYSFLRLRGDEDMFDMHSLIPLATRIWSENQEQLDRARHDVLAHLVQVFPL